MGLRPRFKTPFGQARDKFVAYAMRPLMVFSPRKRFMIGCCALVLLTTLLLISYSAPFSENYKEGEVLTKTIVVPADITTIDRSETDRRKAAAREASRPVFNYDSSRSETSAQGFRAAWEELKKSGGARDSNLFSGVGGKALASAISAHKFNDADLNQLATLIREVGAGYIYDDSDGERLKQEIVLVDVRNPTEHMIIPSPRTRMIALSAARRNIELRVLNLPGWSQQDKTALSSMLASLIRPNVVLDQAVTAAAREAEADKIPPVAISLKRNQVLAREGDTVTPSLLNQFAAIKSSGHSGRPWHNLIGLLLIVSALYWGAWKFTEHRSTASALHLGKHKAFGLVGSAILVQTALMRIGFTFGDSLAAQRVNAPFNDPLIWNFAIPFAAAALLVAMLMDTQLAFLTGIITALFAGMIAPTGMLTVLFAAISCSAAVYGIGRYRERQSVTLAGLFVGSVNVVMALALIAYAEHPLTLKTFLLAIGCGLSGGLLSAVFTAGGLPINESVFGILTDVKLLELSNADLPVLGQLALRAPGTNQHSHAVGQLAEDASRVVGANPLLARIGALYHDIGKLAAPEYFVENQQGDNPHDRLKPQQSAKIITSHVTYGSKLAKEIGLPKKIADFIPQHHGTRTLHYFLRRAQAQANPGETIDENDFRYPGPKPQFKEAAIMMLADSCEAAARSLARPDPENIRAIVIKIVDAIITDGQLDQCDITLQELTTIREAMISALTAIYHARIDYPGFNPPALTAPLPTLPAGDLDSEERGVSYSKPSEVPINKAGEVEDEAIPRRAGRR
ncbi:MAG TPA: HDIG domain-containing protein [Pyrinomonadaceae bacterium]